MKTKVTALFLVFAALIVAVYFGYQKYNERKVMLSIYPLVKDVSLRVSNALEYITKEDATITHKELIEKLENDILEVDKKLFDIQKMSTPRTKKKIDVIVSYLKVCQELLRAELRQYQLYLLVKQSFDLLTDTRKLYEDSSYYFRDYAKKRLSTVEKQCVEIFPEYIEAIKDYITAVNKLFDERQKIVTLVPEENLVDISILEKVMKINEILKTVIKVTRKR